MQFDEQDMQKRMKRMDSISNCLRRVSKTVKFIFIIIALIVGFIILVNLNVNISNFRTSVNADVDSLKDMYGIKTNIISQDTDENGNGKYIFELKNKNEIKFTAVKDWRNLSEDFKANYQKYVYDNWNGKTKEKFIVKEYIDSKGLLNYENDIIIDNISKLDYTLEYYIEFLEYAEKWNKGNKVLKNAWQKEGQFIVPINIGIQINEDIIYPYNGMYQTADDIRTNANNYINEIYMNQ